MPFFLISIIYHSFQPFVCQVKYENIKVEEKTPQSNNFEKYQKVIKRFRQLKAKL